MNNAPHWGARNIWRGSKTAENEPFEADVKTLTLKLLNWKRKSFDCPCEAVPAQALLASLEMNNYSCSFAKLCTFLK